MSRKRRKIPMLIMSKKDIWKSRGRYPRKEHKPLCGKCEKPCNKISIDTGYKKKNKSRGRPAKKQNDKRRVHIGWYCKYCKIFYYPDGSPDWQGVT